MTTARNSYVVASADATHYLECSHCIGKNRKSYLMPCIVLKKMKDGRVKLVVFGNRDWADSLHLKRIRYVPESRLSWVKIPSRFGH